MDLTPIGAAALLSREGNKLTSYKDSVGVWTIGVGVTHIDGKPVRAGIKITAAESAALFAKTVRAYVDAVGKAVKVPLADHQADALISLCYNIGIGGFAGSTVVKRLNTKDYGGAADAILMWKKPPEIVSRRQAEHVQFLTPYSSSLPRGRSTDREPVTIPPLPSDGRVVAKPCPTCSGTGKVAA